MNISSSIKKGVKLHCVQFFVVFEGLKGKIEESVQKWSSLKCEAGQLSILEIF